MRVHDGNRGFIAERNYHTDLLWNYGNFKRLAALPRCHCWLGTLSALSYARDRPSRAVPWDHSALPQHRVPAKGPSVVPKPLLPVWALLGLEELVPRWDTGTAGHSGALGIPRATSVTGAPSMKRSRAAALCAGLQGDLPQAAPWLQEGRGDTGSCRVVGSPGAGALWGAARGSAGAKV